MGGVAREANSKFELGWTLFNITFICFYQHALLLLITAPCAWAATTYAQTGSVTWRV